MRAYRIRVYGKPRKNIDAHQFVQAVLMLARELRDQYLYEQAAASSTGPESEAVTDDG
jgi:hypothetical protein